MTDHTIRKDAAELTRGVVHLLGRTGKRALLRTILPALIGFALARTPIPGGLYPFGAAFAASVPGGSTAAGLMGVLLGFVLPGSGADALRCAASALAVSGIKWALAELRYIKDSPLFPPAAALAGVTLTGAVVTYSVGGAVSYDLARYFAEGAMAAAGAYFFCGAMDGWRRRESRSLSAQDMYCMAAAVCVLCVPLCRLSIMGFSPLAAAVMVGALAVAARYGAAGGAAAGIGLGMVLALADMRFSLLGVCAAACLCAALFNPLGAVAVSAVFCVGCGLCTAASGQVDLFFLAEAALAGIAFPIIGEQRLAFVFDIIEPVSRVRSDTPPDDYVSRRLSSAARGLEEASAAVQEVSRRLERLEAPRAETVCRRATEELCADCAISRFCWDTSREQSLGLFDSLSAVLRRDGRLTRENTPGELRERCARWGEMRDRMNALYAEYAAEEAAMRRIGRMRRAAACQMTGCGRLLSELADESGREERRSAELSRQAAAALEEYGFEAEGVSCLERFDGMLTVTLTLRTSEEDPEPEESAAEVLSDILCTKFECTDILREGDSVMMRLDSLPRYRVAVGAAQHSKCGSRLCGDAYKVMDDSPGRTTILLSDGMGSGGRAAVDAAMTCGLMSRLLSAGFSEMSAMELVNSAMQISSRDETLATVDCARVDLCSGRLTLSKAGAAASYIMSGGRVSELESDSLPLGIMERVDSRIRSMELREGDLLIMVSDGAGIDAKWLEEEINSGKTGDMQRLARDILSFSLAANKEEDDVTVIVIGLELRDVREDRRAA